MASAIRLRRALRRPTVSRTHRETACLKPAAPASARHPSSQALVRAWGRQAAQGCLSWGSFPLQHLRLALRWVRSCQPSDSSRFGVDRPCGFSPRASAARPSFRGPPGGALPARWSFVAGFLARDVSDPRHAGSTRPRQDAELALCLRFTPRQRSWGSMPFAALFLRPGQRKRLRPAHPTCRFPKARLACFRRGDGREFHGSKAADPRGFRRGSWVFPRYSAPPALMRWQHHSHPKSRRAAAMGLGLFQVFGHLSMRQRELDLALPARPWPLFHSKSPSAHELHRHDCAAARWSPPRLARASSRLLFSVFSKTRA